MNYCYECRHRGGSWLWWYDYCSEKKLMIPLKRGGDTKKACTEFEVK